MDLLAIPTPSRDELGRWDLREVLAWQRRLREAVIEHDALGPVRRVAGADIAYDRVDERLYAGVVVVAIPSLQVIETASTVARTRFPYLTGLLSLREAPPLIEAISRLNQRPDLLLVDGHGRAHPRGFGVACHLGLHFDIPTIGVAKSVLVGRFETPGPRRGAYRPLVHRDAVVGEALRTRDGVAPVFVSVGHRVSLPTAREWVLACGRGFRLPEPTRRAHLTVNALRAGKAAR